MGLVALFSGDHPVSRQRAANNARALGDTDHAGGLAQQLVTTHHAQGWLQSLMGAHMIANPDFFRRQQAQSIAHPRPLAPFCKLRRVHTEQQLVAKFGCPAYRGLILQRLQAIRTQRMNVDNHGRHWLRRGRTGGHGKGQQQASTHIHSANSRRRRRDLSAQWRRTADGRDH